MKDLYLSALGITISRLAEDLGVSRKAMSAIVNGRKRITPEMALRLAKALDTTPEMWLNLQSSYDLWLAEQSIAEEIDLIGSLTAMA